jgi:monothiol glutaredoxin
MNIEQTITQQIQNNPVIVYMKGTPDFPQCGFSSRVVSVLESYGVPFAHINILENPEIRSTLPKMMNWPTFPQVYVNAELVGGCDIICDLHESGELTALFADIAKP